MRARALLLASGAALAAALGCADPPPPVAEGTGSLAEAVAAADSAALSDTTALAPVTMGLPAPEAPEATPAASGVRPPPPAPTAATATPEAAAHEPEPGARYALLVGVSDYPGTRDDLPSGGADVAAMRDLLVGRYGFRPEHVLTLTDREATRGAVRRAVARHLGRAGGTAVLYFSGHGVRLAGNLGRPDSEREGRDEAFYLWADDRASGALVLDDEIGAWTDALPARRVLVVLDACHSGTGARAVAGGGPPVKEVEIDDVRRTLDAAAPWASGASAAPGVAAPDAGRTVLLAAARDREAAYAGLGGEPSLFTATLTEVLGALDPATPLAEAMRAVRARVEAVSTGYGAAHSPQLEGGAGLSLADLLGR